MVGIVWAPHQDHVEKSAKYLGAQLFCIHYFAYQRPWIAPLKYILQTLKTLAILFRLRPKLVYVLNPPVVAPLVTWFYCKLTNAKFIMNSHYSAIYGPKWRWSLFLTRFLARQALVNVLDHEKKGLLFQGWGAKTIILEKPPAEERFSGKLLSMENEKLTIVVVNTFAEDDPLDEILLAASLCQEVNWLILGDTALAKPHWLMEAPSNVVFTGYLLGDDYWRCLQSASAVVTLTTRPYSLMASAIDALAISKPLILSRQPILEEYFTKGVVFVDNNAKSIAQGVAEICTHLEQLADEIDSLRAEKIVHWRNNFEQLKEIVSLTN